MVNRQTRAVLVTGGRGFIGRHLVRHLVETQNAPVLSVDVAPVNRETSNNASIELQADVCDRNAMHELFAQFGIATIFDLASITQVRLARGEYAPNVKMTQVMVDCAQRFNVEKYAFFSTQLVFRKEGKPPAHDQDYNPIDDYGGSKIESEQWIINSLPSERRLILRPTYIWGEGHRRFRDGFIYRLAKGQMMLPAAGEVLRYYGYVGTVCKQATALAAKPFSELASTTFYLSDEPIFMRQFCQYFIEALGRGHVWKIPASVLRALGQFGELTRTCGVSFPINALQANEMTRNYPVPVEPTLAVTGTSTDYPSATAAVVAWALSDPDFCRRIGMRTAVSQ